MARDYSNKIIHVGDTVTRVVSRMTREFEGRKTYIVTQVNNDTIHLMDKSTSLNKGEWISSNFVLPRKYKDFGDLI